MITKINVIGCFFTTFDIIYTMIIGVYNMNQKKAFTLVELLAVIVVLAILAVITVPIVINTIAEAEKGAFLSSVDSYTRAVRTEYVIDSLNQKN